MAASTFLPHVKSRPLMVVVLVMVALYGALVLQSLVELFLQPDWGASIMAATWFLLGVGMWRLHPAARWVTVILLWILILVLIGGAINPFTAGDLMAEGKTPPSVWMLAAWIAPAVIVSLAVIHIL